ncbi:undecaprenyl-diphosphate phosphatase [Dermatophilus congolensis]|uniref:undecaprenyl-diphosphate phosphatase n=1 Tax=Dermatophilus congolensis TaxID=1863 RepID=UPI001AAF57C8|nr:undecaprenyl-diphosphate phosphatase [Dermatophilus congolensis]MBO3143778.1 undecaprenyl-diphosphate phosphatase [Dermatophilus congolensis]MBO3152769.1 undecaprenyl-diphosphate phosphatase [Dermatophilus congolensis]MBO3160220.1 undecaprenyl-diphosphate phosphatase [Dermatophilus congolensis]MBO3164054.1 undecaprenyl-diphosphate phosphatase [Dermatophilus congolensis]MBO3177599.1 undecaprenyl-diphosphate phosphatase [Dermatophilus congolensis]
MDWGQALSLGVVQGLTEFLPISSSAHVSLAGRFFGKDPGAAFTAITQLGTEAAVLLYFRKDIGRIAKRWCKAVTGKIPHSDPDARMGWLVIVGSIPIGALGIVLSDLIKGPFRSLWVTATMLIVFSAVIWFADRNARQTKDLTNLTISDGLRYGLWQACALIPGVSRSGGTISGGLLMGYSREAATRYSFLLAVPAVLASGFQQLFDISSDPAPPAWGPIMGATTVSFFIGYAVIAWLLRYVSTHNFTPFVIYRIALAIGLIIALSTGTIPAIDPGTSQS